MCEDFEMPTPCQKCGNIFDLNDGTGSVKWFPNTVICSKCGDEEEREIEKDEEIEELTNQISDALITIRDARLRLLELGSEAPAALFSNIHISHFPDNEADGYVFCGKCGKMKE